VLVETFNAYPAMLDSELVPDFRESYADYSKAALSVIFSFWKSRKMSPPALGSLYNVLQSEQEESSKDITGNRGNYHIGIGNTQRLDRKIPIRPILKIDKNYKNGDRFEYLEPNPFGHGYWYYQWIGETPEGNHPFFEKAFDYLETHGSMVFNRFLNKLAGDWNIV
jgi:hypothetical protein